MSETGQPGAATPGEHGDGAGQRDDLARSGNGWAPSAADWSWGGDDSAATWRQPEPPPGWATAAPRYADLPAPMGERAWPEQPARVNGHHVNGVHQPEEPAGGQYAPVSAPPGPREAGHDPGRDRLVVPAPRPASSGEQPGAAGLPTSAPPAVQVPPVGTAASGFEVPPGLHAPTVERSDDVPTSGPPAGWEDAFAPEPTHETRPASPDSGRPAAADRSAAPGEAAGPPPTEPPAPEPERPSWARSGTANDWAPSWARGDAPSWAHGDGESTGRRSREAPAQGWVSEPSRPYEPVRAEPTRPYEAVPVERPRPYEPARAEARPGPGQEPAAEPEPAADRPSWAAEPPSAPPSPERPSWAAQSTSGPPAGEYPSWGARPVSGAPADDALPWGARLDEGQSWGGRGSGQPPGEERLPWALGPASAPPASTPQPTSAPPASAPPALRDAPPEPGSAMPVAEAAAADPPGYRPFRLRPVPSEPAPPPQPAPDPVVTRPASASTDPADGASASGTSRRERTPTAPVPTSAAPYAARRSAPDPELSGERSPDSTSAVLPQRVPAEPDVPVVPEPPAVDPPAETPELARIATHLRRDDEPAPLRERPEGFDVNAILDAVREVDGVRDASLRRTPAGAHSLRLDLSDGADPAEVSRHVARLLQERMGLAAAPHGVPETPVAPMRRRSVENRGGDGGEARAAGEPRRPANRPAAARAEAIAARTEQVPETSRRRRPAPAAGRGRATVEEVSPPGSPATLGASYSGGQLTTTESAPSRPLNTGGTPGPRVVLDHVQVSTFGLEATVEVRLIAGDQNSAGYATGPAVDGYVLRLCAVAAAAAIDELLRGTGATTDRGRCFVEHAAVVPFGNCEVATVVVLLVCDGWVEQLAGSALVAGDPRQAVVRATLAAVNRRLEALLA